MIKVKDIILNENEILSIKNYRTYNYVHMLDIDFAENGICILFKSGKEKRYKDISVEDIDLEINNKVGD